MGSSSSTTNEDFKLDDDEFDSWHQFKKSDLYNDIKEMHKGLWDFFFAMEVCDNQPDINSNIAKYIVLQTHFYIQLKIAIVN